MDKLILILLIYFFIINLYGFIICGIDKQKARKHEFRISENHLFATSFIGGCFGVLLGMKQFRHKTKHLKFTIGIPFICILWLTLITYLSYMYFIK